MDTMQLIFFIFIAVMTSLNTMLLSQISKQIKG